MIANFDFLEDRTVFPKIKYEAPLCIQPYSTNRQPRWPYSAIGPWSGSIIKGIVVENGVVFGLNMTPPMMKNNDMLTIKCKRVTNQAFIVNDILHYKRSKFPLAEGRVVYPLDEAFWGNRLFIRYKKIEEFGNIRYYFELFEKNNDGNLSFVEVPFIVRSYPRNNHTTIIHGFDCPTITDFINNYEYFVKKSYHFLPIVYHSGLIKETEPPIREYHRLKFEDYEDLVQDKVEKLPDVVESKIMSHLKLRPPEQEIDKKLDVRTRVLPPGRRREKY